MWKTQKLKIKNKTKERTKEKRKQEKKTESMFAIRHFEEVQFNDFPSTSSVKVLFQEFC